MALGVLGKKIGMTNVFTEDGRSLPVTVIQIDNNRVTQIKTASKEGYNAVQVAEGTQHPARINKCQAGHLAKAGSEPAKKLVEFTVDEQVLEQLELGSEINVSQFEQGQLVDIKGTTQGKGTAGTIKKYNFNRQPATHGAATVHRKPGSIGQCQTPGRVFKGKKMPGRMGHNNITQQSLEVVSVDAERNLMLVKGACPGAKGTYLKVLPAVKAKR